MPAKGGVAHISLPDAGADPAVVAGEATLAPPVATPGSAAERRRGIVMLAAGLFPTPAFALAQEFQALAASAALLLVVAALTVLLFVQRGRVQRLRHKQRQLKQRLRARDAQLRSLLDSAPDAVLLVNAGGRVVMANREAEALFGFAHGGLTRLPVEHLLPEDLRAAHVALRAQYMTRPLTHTMGDGRPLSGVTKAGESIPLEIRLARIQHHGRDYVAASIRDLRERLRAQAAIREQAALRQRIDEAERLAEDLALARAETENYRDQLEQQVHTRTEELRRSREELQAILDNSPTLISVKDRKGRYTLVNDRWCEFARLSEDRVIGREDVELFAPEVLAGMAREDDIVLRHGEPRLFEEVRTAGTSEIVLETYKFPLLDAQGRPYGLCGISHDITERNQAELALRRARDDAQAASRAKTRFLANLSHEIRTPINAIIGNTHLALGTELSSRQHEYIENAHASANELLGVITDLLDFARVEAGNLTLDSVPFQLEDILATLGQTIGPKAARKGLEFLCDAPADLPAELVGDPLRLSQLLINLGSNAVKFTEHGEVVVRARVAERSMQHMLLQFSFTDTGIGISAEEQARLFEPFHQADSSTTRRFGGTGLGLAICKRLTELMDGRIWVESEPGVGSVFHCTARFGQGELTAAAAAAPRIEGRVLVVDDNASARGILTMLLESVGPRTGSAANGEEALRELITASAGDDPYDAVLLDWHMPGRDGLSVARAIAGDARLGRKPRIIMLTAHQNEQDLAERMHGLNIVSCLDKPLSVQSLRQALLLDHEPAQRPRTMARRRFGDPKHLEQLRGSRLLLAEDHAINRELAEEILSAAGARVDTAHNGREALSKVLDNSYDAVLMDTELPKMDGFGVVEAVRAMPDHAGLPIIAMLASDTPEQRRRALASGMNDHLAKPLDVEVLFATLARWIGNSDPAEAPMPPPASLPAPPSGPISGSISDSVPGSVPEAAPESTQAPGLAELTPLRRAMLARFCDEYRAFATDLMAGWHQGDDSAVRLAHTIKGVAANLGLAEIAELAAELEQALRAKGAADTWTPVVARLEERIAALDVSLQALAPLATQPPACCDAPQLSPERAAEVRQLVRELESMLAEGDARALGAAKELVKSVGTQSEFGRALEALSEQVQLFEFQRALSALQALARQIERLGDTASPPADGADALTERLAVLLDQDDAEALQVAVRLRQAVSSYADAARLRPLAERIAQLVDRFDYTAARHELSDLQRQIEAREPGDAQ